MMNKRILFVDDEREVLDGLRNRLRRRRKIWDMTFVESGMAALEALAKESFDAVVLDMRMPQMDGATLLQRLRENHPTVARLVLSGQADEQAMLQALSVSYQFLPKPCDPGALEDAIERVCCLQGLMNDEAIKEAVGKMTSLPPQPQVYAKFMETINNDQSSPGDVAQILKQDGALCVELLHIVNSAYFRLARPIVKIEEAVLYLGLGTIKQLILIAEIFSEKNKLNVDGISLDALHKHAILTGAIVSEIVTDAEKKETAFMAALLHDIGKLLIANELPDRMRKIIAEVRAQPGPMHLVEQRLFNITHAEIGAYLLGLWQIPYPVIEAVANHHLPSRTGAQEFGVLGAVHVADFLANEQAIDTSHGPEAGCCAPMLDTAFLDQFGIKEKMDQWREVARKLVQNLASI